MMENALRDFEIKDDLTKKRMFHKDIIWMIRQFERGTQTRRHLYAEFLDCKTGIYIFTRIFKCTYYESSKLFEIFDVNTCLHYNIHIV